MGWSGRCGSTQERAGVWPLICVHHLLEPHVVAIKVHMGTSLSLRFSPWNPRAQDPQERPTGWAVLRECHARSEGCGEGRS